MRDIITIRASSIADLFDCAFRWEGKHLLGLRNPISRAMILGTAVHAGTAAFDSAKLAGAPITPDEAAGALVDKLNNPGEDVREDEDDPPIAESERIGLTLHTRYCVELSPRYEFRAVELDVGKLDIEIPRESVTVSLTGHLDRTRTVKGKHGVRIADIKTGARAATKDGRADVKGKGLQIGVYQLLTEAVLHEPVDPIGEIIGLATNKSASIGVSEIAAPKLQILGTDEHPSLIEIAGNMVRTGYFPPNPKSMTCGEKYCPRWATCPYHE